LNGPDCSYVADDIHTLQQLPSGHFDLVCCWQTLSWIPRPEEAVRQLVRIAAPGGIIMASALFNLDHDVDIYAQLRDRTRPSGEQGHAYDYNTFSRASVAEWLDGRVKTYQLHPFMMNIDLPKEVDRSGQVHRGVGTYTVNTDAGRIQISAGLLMNWAILEIGK
jgi:SAM-dependent methyltransferase